VQKEIAMDVIQPSQLPAPEPYSLGIRVDNMLWVAGQCAIGDDGELVGPGDPRAQAACIYRRIGLILAEAGATPQDVTFVRTYMTDMRFGPVIREERYKFFQGHKPASTTVQVVALAQPEYLLEVEVYAVIRSGSRG
jgi:enamine deaminase RidA (YjgF/YER057c/UK114 family)